MFKLLVIAVFSTLIGFVVHKSPGYISFVYNNVLIQIPSWLVVLCIVLILCTQIWLISIAIKHWLQDKKFDQSIVLAKKAFFSLIAGKACLAEKQAMKCSSNHSFNWLGSLLASKAAKEQGCWDRSLKHLFTAEMATNHLSNNILPFTENNHTISFGLLKTELYYSQGEYNKCLKELEMLYRKFSNNKNILLQLIAIYKTLGHWQNLIRLLPSVRKQQIYSHFDYNQLEFTAYQNTITELAETQSINTVMKFFAKLPKSLKKNSQFIVIYVTYLIKYSYYDLAEKTIKYHLSGPLDNWLPELIKLYGLIKSSSLKNQIKTAEKWLKLHNKDQNLLLTLGRLYMRDGLLGKAKNYLERSLQIQELPDCYAELGRLSDLIGEKEQSLICFQKGLARTTKTVEL